MARRRRAPAAAPEHEAIAAEEAALEESRRAYAEEDARRRAEAAEDERAHKQLEVVGTVEALLARDVPKGQIYRTLRNQHGVGLTAAQALVEDVERRLVERFLRRSRSQSTAAALARAYSYLRRAEADKKLDLVLRIEHLIKDLEGTKAPDRLEVSHTVSDAYAAVFGAMDAEEFAELVSEGVEQARLAERARQEGAVH